MRVLVLLVLVTAVGALFPLAAEARCSRRLRPRACQRAGCFPLWLGRVCLPSGRCARSVSYCLNSERQRAVFCRMRRGGSVAFHRAQCARRRNVCVWDDAGGVCVRIPGAPTPAPEAVPTPAPEPPSKFDIQIEWLSPRTPEQQAAFDNAVARWRAVIRGDLRGTVTVQEGQGCGGAVAPRGIVFDDLLIFARIMPIDGRAGVLGRAGACWMRDSIPRMGMMEFDEADVEWLIRSGGWESTVMHEIGHVLGFSKFFFNMHGLSTCYDSNKYTGAGGVRGHEAVGGEGPPRLEVSTGSLGSDCSHWANSLYRNELMTPFLSAGGSPLSRMTVGALQDIGYQVNEAAADEYTVPPLPDLLALDGNALFGDDVLPLTPVEAPGDEAGGGNATARGGEHLGAGGALRGGV